MRSYQLLVALGATTFLHCGSPSTGVGTDGGNSDSGSADAPTEPGTAPPPDLSWIAKARPPQRPVPGANKPRPYVIFVPGGSARHMDKRWPVEK